MTYAFTIVKRNKRKDNKYKLVLRVYNSGKIKYFDVIQNHAKIYLTEDEYNGLSKYKKLRHIAQHIINETDRIEGILRKMSTFTMVRFKAEYEQSALLSDCFKRKIEELTKARQFSTSESYGYAAKVFPDIAVMKIDEEYVADFIERSVAYPAVYLRYLRHILRRSGNPLKFQIKGKTKTKVGLLPTEVDVLKNYRSPSVTRQRSVDFWLLSYYGAGMNTKDWVFLKSSEYLGDAILKNRAKTDVETIVKISAPLEKLIDKYRVHGAYYVFPILSEELTPKQKHNKYKNFLGRMRKQLKEIGKEHNFRTDLTPYTARHTQANVLLNSGFSTSELQKYMGHKSIKSTEIYTGSLYDQKMKDMSDKL